LAGQIYVWVGLAVAVVFLVWGLDRIDAKGHGAWMFRPLLVPGIILIWPLVLWRWQVLARESDNLQNRHRPPLTTQRLLGLALALAIPVIIVGALLLRQDGPLERPAVMLETAVETTSNE
ncbi:MAG: hypothetical protein AAGC86_18175, partial [Pseudomonadota bacterium]